MANDRARHDINLLPSLIAVSNADGESPVTLWADPATHALVTSGGGGGGSDVQYVEGATNSPATGNLSLGRYVSSPLSLTNGQMAGLQLDSAGNLKVVGSITVGGTTDESSFVAGTSSFNPSGGVFNDSVAALTSGQQGTQRLTANRGLHVNLRSVAGTEIGTSANPVRTDPTGSTTQPVSAASLPLPAGASTSAKQPALGTAGTASSDVLTIQGIASMTPLKTDGSGTTQPVSGTVTANAGTNLNTSLLALESGNLASIKADTDKIPSQGQALAAASMPVVLPSAQITALTPPSNTGYALDSSLSTIDTDLKNNITLHAGTNLIGKVGIDQTTPGTTNAVSANQGTAAAVSAGWPVIGGELADTTGTFTNATQTNSVTTSNFDGYSTIIVSISGTYGTATGVFEISDDGGTTWYSVNAARTDGSGVETGYSALINTARMWTLSVSGADEFRVRSTAVASGTANIRISVESMPTPESASVSAYQPTAANFNATIVGTGTLQVQTSADVPGTGATNLGKAEDAASASGDTGVFVLGVRNDTIADITNTNGDYTQFSTDVKGHMMTANAPRLLKVQQQTTITSSTAETTVLTAVASTFLDVYGIILTNTSATACAVTVKDATAGTTRFVLQVPAGDTRGFMLPIDAAHNQAAVNNNWTVTCGTSVASIQVTMFAVKNI